MALSKQQSPETSVGIYRKQTFLFLSLSLCFVVLYFTKSDYRSKRMLALFLKEQQSLHYRRTQKKESCLYQIRLSVQRVKCVKKLVKTTSSFSAQPCVKTQRSYFRVSLQESLQNCKEVGGKKQLYCFQCSHA